MENVFNRPFLNGTFNKSFFQLAINLILKIHILVVFSFFLNFLTNKNEISENARLYILSILWLLF